MQDGLQDFYFFFTFKQTRKKKQLSAPEIKTVKIDRNEKVKIVRDIRISRYSFISCRTAWYKQFWEEKYKYMQ